ncbi:MAG: hypothetical protein Q7J05_03690 [Paludibacter sp.]|nr:hypothetical protein [Paludibacter sp.]
MKKLFTLFVVLCMLHFGVFAQISEGGGVYIQNNGKLINSIVHTNYASMGFGIAGTSGEVLNCNVYGNLYLSKEIMIAGDMYLGDGTVYSPTYDSAGNLKPIPDSIKSNVLGVCFWSNANNDYINAQFWIVSVDEPAPMHWGPNNVDIPDLYNYNSPAYVVTDLDGKANTEAILAGYGGAATVGNCAAKYCAEYGTPATVGQWFLPSGGQMRELLRNLSVINEIMSELGKTPLSTSTGYWVANENSMTNAWSLSTADGETVTGLNPAKATALNFRPMIIVSRD